jgi:hypothetical protein
VSACFYCIIPQKANVNISADNRFDFSPTVADRIYDVRFLVGFSGWDRSLLDMKSPAALRGTNDTLREPVDDALSVSTYGRSQALRHPLDRPATTPLSSAREDAKHIAFRFFIQHAAHFQQVFCQSKGLDHCSSIYDVGLFVGGVVTIRVVSRVIHGYIPSKVVEIP